METRYALSRRSLCPLGVVGLVVLGSTSAANAGLIDFNGLSHGEIVNNQFLSDGVLISAINPNRPFDLAIAFDTNATNTADPDLEGPNWTSGNLAQTDLSNILVISENDDPGNNPDDEGSSPAGQLIFDFDAPITEFGFDLIDMDHPDTTPTYVRFYGGSDLVLEIDIRDYAELASGLYDPSVEYGDNSANRYAPISLAPPPGDFEGPLVTRVVFDFGESGGVDNIVFTSVPTPGSLALIGLAALTGFGWRVRRS